MPTILRAAGNGIRQELDAPLTDSGLSVTMDDGTPFSSSGGLIEIDYDDITKRERVYYLSKAGDVLTIADDGRGLFGTTAVAHDAGALVRVFFVDEHINNLVDLAETTEDYVTILNSSADTGWNPVSDGWSYASPTTITVPSGAASLYTIGEKVRLTQTTVKYFYIVGISDTVLTITGGSDYTLANAGISSISTAKGNAIGFPDKFNRVPTWTGSTTNPVYNNATLEAIFSMRGRVVSEEIAIIMGTTTTYGSGSYFFDLAVSPDVVGSNKTTVLGSGIVHDLGVGNYSVIALLNSDTTVRMAVTGGVTEVAHNVPITFTTSDRISLNLNYLV